MRKFLLIFACAFSFFVRAEGTNAVYWTQEQWNTFQNWLDYTGFWLEIYGDDIYVNSNGSISEIEANSPIYFLPFQLNRNIYQLMQQLHLLATGDLTAQYDTSSNNILAYASSLRDHNKDVREFLDSIEQNTHGLWMTLGGFTPYFSGIYDTTRIFHTDYTNNFERLYDAITNIDFNISISNQIDLLQSMSGSISNDMKDVTNLLQKILRGIDDFNLAEGQRWNFHFQNQNDLLRGQHTELMDFLHSLSNSNLFVSNLCNCCGGANSNYQDSVIAMLDWMTNNFPDVAESPIYGGGGSNSVWWVWRPDRTGYPNLLIPNVAWEEDFNNGGWRPLYKPRNEQYDQNFLSISQQYDALLTDFEAGNIDGQKFFTGLVDMQLHILANLSTQLYILDEKMPTKTNLWEWIEEYKNKVSEEVTKAERENNEIVSSVSSLLDYTPFSIVGGHFPKVSNALNNLRLEEGSSPVVRIPIPRALRVSDSDELVVDVRNSDWFTSGRNWCRWIFTFIWGWLFIRLGIVPIFYVFFFTVRVAEISAHLVFMGSVRGSSGIVSSFGASAVDMILSLIGIDTDFKKFVWGIMRD